MLQKSGKMLPASRKAMQKAGWKDTLKNLNPTVRLAEERKIVADKKSKSKLWSGKRKENRNLIKRSKRLKTITRKHSCQTRKFNFANSSNQGIVNEEMRVLIFIRRKSCLANTYTHLEFAYLETNAHTPMIDLRLKKFIHSLSKIMNSSKWSIQESRTLTSVDSL